MSAGAVPGRASRARHGLEVLGPAALAEVTEFLDAQPDVDVFVASRVEASGLEPRRLGGQLWGYCRAGELTGLCYSGANLVPVRADNEAGSAFAHRAAGRPRRCSSVVGRAHDVLRMWSILSPAWGQAREVRQCQPVLTISEAPHAIPDPWVRPVASSELDALLPAAIAMFTEEVGVSPVGSDGATFYRARMSELVRAGRSFARFEDGEVVFKADVGSVSRQACQVQGVWVHPARRGQGLATPGMAAVVELARARIAPVVSLYVNDFNAPARATYQRVGFTAVDTFATVLF